MHKLNEKMKKIKNDTGKQNTDQMKHKKKRKTYSDGKYFFK